MTEKVNLKGINLIEISGCGCAGCEALAPSLKAVAESLGTGFIRLEAEERPDLVQSWEIVRIPAAVLADGTEIICKCYGYQPQEILEIYMEDKLNGYLKENTK